MKGEYRIILSNLSLSSGSRRRFYGYCVYDLYVTVCSRHSRDVLSVSHLCINVFINKLTWKWFVTQDFLVYCLLDRNYRINRRILGRVLITCLTIWVKLLFSLRSLQYIIHVVSCVSSILSMLCHLPSFSLSIPLSPFPFCSINIWHFTIYVLFCFVDSKGVPPYGSNLKVTYTFLSECNLKGITKGQKIGRHLVLLYSYTLHHRVSSMVGI